MRKAVPPVSNTPV